MKTKAKQTAGVKSKRVTNSEILERLASIETRMLGVSEDVKAIKERVFDGLTLDVRLLQDQLGDLLAEREERQRLKFYEELKALRRETERQTRAALDQARQARRANVLTLLGLGISALAAVVLRLLGAI